MLVERDRELAAIETVLARGGVLVVEAGAGIGKTALLDVARARAAARGSEVLAATGSELESDFAFGVVRQLFERRLTQEDASKREELVAGPAAAVRALLVSDGTGEAAFDASFAILHGLYWLAANLAERTPLVVVVDDAHWADAPSQRFLAHLAPRIEGLSLTLLVGMRATEPASEDAAMSVLREHATVLRPELLSEHAVTEIARAAIGADANAELCAALSRASGGNPFYLAELLRSGQATNSERRPADQEVITRHVVARIRGLEPGALALAQSLAILGDGCQLRHAALVAGVDPGTATRGAAGLVRAEVLAGIDPPRFLHPIVRDAVEASLRFEERDAAHRAASRVLFTEGSAPGQVAAHLVQLQPLGDPWVVACLREAARSAMEAGASDAAVMLLRRALAEPTVADERVDVLRDLARAEVNAGRETASRWLDEALELTVDPMARGAIWLEMAETCAAVFRWVDAVDAIDRALTELGDADPALTDCLEAELVVAALHDARRASRVGPALDRLAARELTGAPAEARAVANGMAMLLAGRPVEEITPVLEGGLALAGPRVENWDTRAALLWSLVTAERYDTVESALQPMLEQVHQSGSARGFVATYSSLGLLEFRRGALPEDDAAARIALRVLQEGDFAPGLAFGASVLADCAVEAGELDEAAALLALLPAEGLSPGVGTVLIPAARGRLLLAQGQLEEAVREFERCAAMFGPDVWGMAMRDVGYLHARSGAAHAWLLLGERERAVTLAEAELADVREFGAPRALGVATRLAGLARGGRRGLELLYESVEHLRRSPALLERAKSLVELGAALRRAGRRVAAREVLTEGLDLAARCGARPLAARARDELKATGARPRREWRQGVEALTPSELRVARLAAAGRTNRQIAQSLYVTPKTVEGHLARVYQKLGISGRVELPRSLDDQKSRVVTP